MTRRRRKRTPIVVEIFGRPLDPAEVSISEAEARWESAGRLLRLADPDNYRRIFALVEAYASLENGRPESDEQVRERIRVIKGARREAN